MKKEEVLRDILIYGLSLAVIFAGAAALRRTDEAGTRSALKAVGLEVTEIIGVPSILHCTSFKATEFRARNPAGEEITGAVCNWPATDKLHISLSKKKLGL